MHQLYALLLHFAASLEEQSKASPLFKTHLYQHFN